MFYSHTFLARKSPLGTVWIAAHLESKLRKSQVAVADIPSSVNYIMFPEVPIALRLSGHLLLGVVRIYSKKVEYLYQECKSACVLFNSVFASERVNLPEDARCAPVQAVTLPETFELDAVDVDDIANVPDGPDSHLKSLKEITLPDQAPFEGTAYISIFLEEDNRNPTPPSKRPRIDDAPMEEDILPPFPNDIAVEISPGRRRVQSNNVEVSPGPGFVLDAGNNAEAHRDGAVRYDAGHNPEVSPDSVEIARHAVDGFEHDLFKPMTPEETVLFQQDGLDNSDSRKRPFSLVREQLLVPNKDVLARSSLHSPSVGVSLDIPEIPILPAFSGLSSIPQLQPSSPVKARLPLATAKRAKRRKKNLPFDDDKITLTNAEMRQQLKDRPDLIRNKEQKGSRQLPSRRLDMWKLQRTMQKERMFQEPIISGLCEKLQKVYYNSYSAARVELSHPDPEAVNPVSKAVNSRPVPEAANPVSEAMNSHIVPEAENPVPEAVNSHPVPEAANPVTEAVNPVPVPVNLHTPERSPVDGHSNEAFIGCSIHSLAKDASNGDNLIAQRDSSINVDSPIENARHFSGEDSRINTHNDGSLFTERFSSIDVQSPVDKLTLDVHADEWTDASKQSLFTFESATPICPSNTDTMSIQQTTIASTVTPWTANTVGTESTLHQSGTSLGQIDERSEFGASFSELPSSLGSPISEDLNFLEVDGTPSSLQNKAIQLSARTRAVANYLKEAKEHSPGVLVTHMSASLPGVLSLNRILEGKKRRQCATMFFETLVLKSCDYIDVKQEEPFGDIAISLTPALYKLRS